MYYYAVLLEGGRGVQRDIAEAVHWLEKAANCPIEDQGMPGRNAGVGEALSALARHHYIGIHYCKDETKAVRLWQRAADLHTPSALNALGVMHSDASSRCVPFDLARARDYLRQAAEKFSSEAMANLANLHASLHDYSTAIRWAKSASRFGYLPAESLVEQYRELAALAPPMSEVDPTLRQFLEETSSIAHMSSPSILRENAAPTLQELRTMRTQYCQRLFRTKALMADAHAYFEDDEMVMGVAYAAQAHQIPDAMLVFSGLETLESVVAVEDMVESGVPLDSDLALILQPPDPAAAVSFWGSLHRRFPENHVLAVRAACALMFDELAGNDSRAGARLFQQTFNLLPNPTDDSDPFTLDLLYQSGSAQLQVEDLATAKTLLSRFLVSAVRDGHRKAPEAHFHLGLIEIANSTREPKSQKRARVRVAAEHYRRGMKLKMELPRFLQFKQVTPNEAMLANMVGVASRALDIPLDVVPSERGVAADASDGVLRGGELLAGPRRHPRLRMARPTLVLQLRVKRVAMAKMAKDTQKPTVLTWTAPPPKRVSHPTRPTTALLPATIDELFSDLKDHVYVSRSLECIVVAQSLFTGSSHSVVVEDSAREPALLALYNLSPRLVDQLVPGRVVRIVNLYVQIARDQSIVLRADDPKLVQLGYLHEICWNCAAAPTSTTGLRICAKCHRAKYCSRECQKEDWKELGHRYLCG